MVAGAEEEEGAEDVTTNNFTPEAVEAHLTEEGEEEEDTNGTKMSTFSIRTPN